MMEKPRGTSRPAQAANYVNWQIRRLTGSGDESRTRASLALLRRGIGKKPGSLPELWRDTLEGMPEGLVGMGGKPSWGEWSCYIALTMFALHQQGKDWKTSCMNLDGQGLGRAVRRLVKNDADEQRIKRRFDQVVTSDSPEESAHHLRGLVQLLKAEGIPLDYPALAADLYRFQNEDERDGVRLRWAREYYAGIRAGDPDKDNATNDETEGGDDHGNEE